MPEPSTAETPWPVRTVSRLLGEWVGRLGTVWVEGQVAELTRRPGMSVAFLTLRDAAADVSLSAVVRVALLDALATPLEPGQQVVARAKAEWGLQRGRLSLQVSEIRPVGLGALLARIEALKAVLRHEGLFEDSRKRPLPFLPGTVGLVTGRESAARRDVEENARRRWPAVRFEVRECVVQGAGAAAAVTACLRELDARPEVDVIVLARGGGSVEDLLPFSDEALCRAVAACRTPVVSAIGHEQDVPLVDLVADVRASTPTDAAKRVVPDVREEVERVARLRAAARRGATTRVEREVAWLAGVRSRPALADPGSAVTRRAQEVLALSTRARRCADAALERAGADLVGARSRLRALSPSAVLDRGYAVVLRSDGTVLRDPGEVAVGDALDVRVAGGRLGAAVTRVTPD